MGKAGEVIEYSFEKDEKISDIRLVFDSDFNRGYYNMPCYYPLVETAYNLPKTLIREYKIEGVSASGEVFELLVTDNHQRFVRHSVDWAVKTVRFVPVATNGCEDFRLFSFEIR